MLIFNLPLVTKETIRYAESIAGFCTLLFADQWSVRQHCGLIIHE